MERLGDILVARGAISRKELEQFAAQQPGPLGKALRTHTMVRSRPLAQALAEQQGLPFLDLNEHPLKPELYQPHCVGHYLQYQFLPHRRIGARLQVVTPEPSTTLKATLEHAYNMPVDLAVISARDFTEALTQCAVTTFTRRARLALRRRYRNLVADRVLFRPQVTGLLLLATALITAFVLAPNTSWHVLLIACNLFYAVTLVFKLLLFVQGGAEAREIRRMQLNIQSLEKQTCRFIPSSCRSTKKASA